MNKIQQRLEAEFTALGIPFGEPGFDAHSNFLRAEQGDSQFLGKYAEFVVHRSYDDVYLQTVRPKIESIANFLASALKMDGRKGACIDASQALSRMLDKLGIWNTMIKGALTISFNPTSGVKRKYFPPIMAPGNMAKAGHVWLVAPPFIVVDVTAKFQPYASGEEEHLPECVLIESLKPCAYDENDLAEHEYRQMLGAYLGRRPNLEDVLRSDPGISSRIAVLGYGEAFVRDVTLKYVSVAGSASDGPLDSMRSLQLNGKYPKEIFSEYLGSLK